MIINTNTSRKNYNKYNTKNTKEEIRLLIKICIIALVGLVLFNTFFGQSKNYSNIKKYKNKFIVYELYNESEAISIPYINIKWDNIERVNKDIDNYCNSLTKKEKTTISYEYMINGNYLSVVLLAIVEPKDNKPYREYKTYNINLKTKQVLSDEYLKDYFKVNDKIIKERVNEKLREYYNDEIVEGYLVEQDCDYECFMNNRALSEQKERKLFIKNGQLYVAQPFDFVSIYSEENYFTNDKFEIQITR